ncbi:hypothetical protein AB0G05_21845 [Nonomuraea wenchangensis]
MYRAGLVLAGLVGGMVVFGGSALAATSGYGPGYGPGHGPSFEWESGQFNNFGDDRDLLDLDLLNGLLGQALS